MDPEIKKTQKRHKIGLILGIGITIPVIVFFSYFGIYYHADEVAKASLKGSDTVNVTKIKGGYYFDGPSNETAFVF